MKQLRFLLAMLLATMFTATASAGNANLQNTTADGDIMWSAFAVGDTDCDWWMNISSNSSALLVNSDSLYNSTSMGTALYGFVMNLSVPTDYTFRLWFNGVEYTDQLTSSGNIYSWSKWTDVSAFAQTGQWVLEIIKPEEVVPEEGFVWSAFAVGDTDCEWWMAISASPTLNINSGALYTSESMETGLSGFYMILSVPTDYTFRLWFNGVEYTDQLTLSDGRYTWSKWTDVAAFTQTGQWVLEIIKPEEVVPEEEFVWSAFAMGDLDATSKVSIRANDSTLVANSSTPYSSQSLGTASPGSILIQVLVTTGSDVHMWFDGVDYTEKFTKDAGDILDSYVWAPFGEQAEPLAKSGQWVVSFKKSAGGPDVNGDGNVNIADVTKLVNILLGK